MDLTEAEDTKRWQEYTKSEVIQLCLTLQPHAYQAPPSMEFSRQEYLSGLPFPSPGNLPDSWIKPGSPALQADALPSEPPGKLIYYRATVNKAVCYLCKN